LRAAFEIADCTSCAAPSMSLSSLKVSVTCVLPRVLVEFMESRPSMDENWLSRGVATAEAMVSGLAPARDAVTLMVGNSTLGRSLTGSCVYPMMPKKTIASIMIVVAMERWIKILISFIS